MGSKRRCLGAGQCEDHGEEENQGRRGAEGGCLDRTEAVGSGDQRMAVK